MSRSLPVLAVLGLLLAAVPVEGRSYESSEFGYRIDLPEGWGLGGTSQTVKAAPLKDRELVVTIQARTIRSVVSERTALRYLAKARQRTAGSAKDFRVVQEPKQTVFGGHTGWCHAVTYDDRAGVQQLGLLYVGSAPRKGQAVFVVLAADMPARLWKAHREQVYALIGSFSFEEEKVALREGDQDYVPPAYTNRGSGSSGPTKKSGSSAQTGSWDTSIPTSSGGKAKAVRKTGVKKGKKNKATGKNTTVQQRSEDYWKKVLKPSFADNNVFDLYRTKKGWQQDIVDRRVVMDATTKATFGQGAGPASSANRTDQERQRALNFFNPAMAQ